MLSVFFMYMNNCFKSVRFLDVFLYNGSTAFSLFSHIHFTALCVEEFFSLFFVFTKYICLCLWYIVHIFCSKMQLFVIYFILCDLLLSIIILVGDLHYYALLFPLLSQLSPLLSW